MCYGMHCGWEDSRGECTFHGRGLYPCEEWEIQGKEAEEQEEFDRVNELLCLDDSASWDSLSDEERKEQEEDAGITRQEALKEYADYL